MGLFSSIGKFFSAPLKLHKEIIRNAAPGNVKKNTMKLLGAGGGKGGAAPPGMALPPQYTENPLMSNAFKQFAEGTLADKSMFARPEAANLMARMMGMQGPAWANPNTPSQQVMAMMGGNPFIPVGGKLPFPNMQQGTPFSQEQMDAYRAEQARLMQDPAYRNLMNMRVDNDMGMSRQPGYAGPGSPLGWAPQWRPGVPEGATPGPAPTLTSMFQKYAGTLGNGGGAMYPNRFRSLLGARNLF